MNPKDLLQEEISIELEAIAQIVQELVTLNGELELREPTVREKTAAAAFLAQFYNGIENILKRICVYYEIPLPTGNAWHVALFQMFCQPAHAPLPELFNNDLAAMLSPYRRFRHVIFHSYGFQLEWNKMIRGIEEIQQVLNNFEKTLIHFLSSI